MKIWKWIVGCVLLCIATSGWAAVQPDAREVLNQVADAFRKAGGIRVEFTLQHAASSHAEKGIICLDGEKFVLEAGGIKTWFDGRTQWSYVQANEEVNVSIPTPEELQTLNPYAWLSLYRQGYKLRMEKVTQQHYELSISSTGVHQAFRRIGLQVDKKTYALTKIRIQQGVSEQDAVLIRIADFRQHQSYADSFFVFNPTKYPNVEIIDLR